MSEFLLEILSEEIPARMQKRAAEDLKRLVTEGLKQANLDFSSAEAYATPCRLVLVIDGLPDKQPDMRDERKGPRVGAPEKAIAGFLRGAGLDSLDQCEKRDTGKGEAWFAVIERAGLLTRDVFPDLLNDVFAKFPWPKSMRWGMEAQSWVRPIQGILCVFDGDVVENINFNGQTAGNITVGHRFLASDPITVSSFTDYKHKLRDAHVLLDSAERRSLIEAALNEQATSEGFTVKDDPALLDEVAGLVEWPVPLLGDIDPEFMELPGEALTSSMRTHQKYFSLLNADGSLAPRFGFVANINALDGGAAIIAGNERVLRARLSDAKFFWDQDRRTRLEDRVPALDAIVFHAKLGTVAEKVQRITVLAEHLAILISTANPAHAKRAAMLCKSDLVTGMVAEFPDLQGVMGSYYAREDGEKLEVARAISEHYSPQGPNDSCPTAPESVAVSLADKIDTLVGFWAINEKPTGSRDPFALRRAALGIVRLIKEGGLRLDLRDIFDRSHQIYWSQIIAKNDRNRITENPDFREFDIVVPELLDFIADRLKVVLRDSYINHDMISAVFSQKQVEMETPGSVDINRIIERANALKIFLDTEDGENLLVAYRRAANILRIEEKKDNEIYQPAFYNESLSEGDEAALWVALEEVSDSSEQLIIEERFVDGMDYLSRLREPIDNFFENVTVNAKASELRKNRLCLLANIVWVMNGIADFSQIEG